MKVGVFMFLTSKTIDVVPLAQRVEALGFDALFLPEHAAVPVAMTSQYPAGETLPDEYRRMYDPFVALAAATTVTRRIKLGTAIAIVPERHPLLSAKVVASLDQVSQGRVIYGVGCGWIKEEGALFDVDWRRRWTQTGDFIKAMKACWGPSPAEYAGSHIRFPPLVCEPKPVQQPHPPVLIAGELEKAVERIAAYGDGWMPRYLWCKQADIEQGRRRLETLYAEAGRDISRLDISLFGGHATRDFHRSFADAGANRVIHFLPMEPEAQTLQRLETIAATLP